jgi:hypothetical protein
MHTNITVTLGPNDEVVRAKADPAALAETVLTALGGDPEKDVVQVSISASATAGGVATPPTQMQPPQMDASLPEPEAE